MIKTNIDFFQKTNLKRFLKENKMSGIRLGTWDNETKYIDLRGYSVVFRTTNLFYHQPNDGTRLADDLHI